MESRRLGAPPAVHGGRPLVSLLLGIDIGTTATKAILLDPERGLVAESQRHVTLNSPHAGWAEEDVDDWWANVVSLCRELAPHGDIGAVGVSGMVPCVILQDASGRAIGRSIQQNDARAVAEIDELRMRLGGARVLERTGSAITQQSVGPTLIWLQRHAPEAWSRARTIAGSYDTIARMLTGCRPSNRTGRSRAAFTTSAPAPGRRTSVRLPGSTRRSCRRSDDPTRLSAP